MEEIFYIQGANKAADNIARYGAVPAMAESFQLVQGGGELTKICQIGAYIHLSFLRRYMGIILKWRIHINSYPVGGIPEMQIILPAHSHAGEVLVAVRDIVLIHLVGKLQYAVYIASKILMEIIPGDRQRIDILGLKEFQSECSRRGHLAVSALISDFTSCSLFS